MDKERKNIIWLYAAFTAGFLMTFVPFAAMALFGTFLFLVVLIAAYIYRFRAEKDSLMENHATFLIRTMWIGSLYLTAGIIGAYLLADHSGIYALVRDIQSGMIPTETYLMSLFQDYVRANAVVFLLTLGPGTLYFLYRFTRGFERAYKGYRVAKPKSWF